MTTFTNFLKNASTKGTSNKPTHTRIGGENIYGGAYHITPEMKTEFNQLYYEKVFNKKNEKEYLTETQSGKCIALDFDFRYEKNVTERQHNDETIDDFIQIYLDAIKTIVQFEPDTEFDIFVMEKDEINSKHSGEYNKDGIHIIIGIQMMHETQMYLRDIVLAKMNEIGGRMCPKVTNTWDKVLDDGISKGTTNWQVIGSQKPNNEPYKITKHLHLIYDDRDSDFAMLSNNIEMTPELFEKMSVQYEHNPVLAYTQNYLNAKKKLADKKPKLSITVESPTSVTQGCNNDEYLAYANIIDKNLLGKGVSNRDNRFKFITASKNIGIGYKTVATILQDAPNNDEDVNMKTYQQTSNSSNLVGMGTIRKLAKDSDMERFMQIYSKFNINLVNEPFSTGLIADYYMEHYGKDKFIYYYKSLYFYNGVRWEKSNEKCTHLHNFIDKILYSNLMDYAQKKLMFYRQKESTCDDDEADACKARTKKVIALLKNISTLRSISARKGMVEDIINNVADNSVKFDNNPHLFAFNNVIIDLRTGQMIEPHPEQYITKSANYDYHTSDRNSEHRKKLEKFLEITFPDADVRKYNLQVLATGLSGVHMENAFINTGEGGNGKSSLNSLMMNTVGEYGYKLPASVILKDLKTGACPEIANLDKKRFVLIQEPNANASISTSVLKEITGDKILNARDLYNSNCAQELSLTLAIEANKLPKLDEVNLALVRRIRVIPFVSRAVSRQVYDELEDHTNICIANPYFKSDEFQNDCRQHLFDILLEEVKNIYANNMELVDVPKQCIEMASAYMKNSDKLFNWFNDAYEKGNDSIIKLTDLYTSFKESEYFGELNKAERRKYNKTFFCSEIEKNLFLRKYIKPRNATFNGKQLSSSILVGWVLKQDE